MSENEATRPMLRVVRGDATPEDVAALVAVLSAVTVTSAGDHGATTPRTLWGSPARRVRPPLRPGPGAWRASSLPR